MSRIKRSRCVAHQVELGTPEHRSTDRSTGAPEGHRGDDNCPAAQRQGHRQGPVSDSG